MAELRVANPILVSGVIRSGTTWLGRLLATCENTVYFHEPFNPHSQWAAAFPVPNQYLYLDRHNGELYEDLMRALLDLKPVFRNRKWMPELVAGLERNLQGDIERLDRSHAVVPVIKDPIALFSSEWLADCFGVRPVFILRHPVTVVQSLLQLNWASKTVFGPMLKQSRLIRRFFAGTVVADELAALPDPDLQPLQRAASFVRFMYFALWRLEQAHPGWLFVKHEDLVRDPGTAVVSLLAALDLRPGPDTLQLIEKRHSADYTPGAQDQHELAPIALEQRQAAFRRLDKLDWRKIHGKYFADLFGELWPIDEYATVPRVTG